MGIQKQAFEESNNVKPDWSFKFDEDLQQYVALDDEMQLQVDEFNEHWDTFRAGWSACLAQKVAVPEGFVLVKKRNMIGNLNVDWLQAPKWAKYWLKDGHSNKYWWSSIRPIKDMDVGAFCWKGDYFAEEAPSFNFTDSWDKSLTSKKAMIEAVEPTHD